jgi:hypothetical protein
MFEQDEDSHQGANIDAMNNLLNEMYSEAEAPVKPNKKIEKHGHFHDLSDIPDKADSFVNALYSHRKLSRVGPKSKLVARLVCVRYVLDQLAITLDRYNQNVPDTWKSYGDWLDQNWKGVWQRVQMPSFLKHVLDEYVCDVLDEQDTTTRSEAHPGGIAIRAGALGQGQNRRDHPLIQDDGIANDHLGCQHLHDIDRLFNEVASVAGINAGRAAYTGGLGRDRSFCPPIQGNRIETAEIQLLQRMAPEPPWTAQELRQDPTRVYRPKNWRNAIHLWEDAMIGLQHAGIPVSQVRLRRERGLMTTKEVVYLTDTNDGTARLSSSFMIHRKDMVRRELLAPRRIYQARLRRYRETDPFWFHTYAATCYQLNDNIVARRYFFDRQAARDFRLAFWYRFFTKRVDAHVKA